MSTSFSHDETPWKIQWSSISRRKWQFGNGFTKGWYSKWRCHWWSIIIDHQSLLPLVTDDRKDFLKSTNRKILFSETHFLTFYFYRQVIKKWNSKLSISIVVDLWSIKMKKCDKIALYKSIHKYWHFFLISAWKHMLWVLIWSVSRRRF